MLTFLCALSADGSYLHGIKIHEYHRKCVLCVLVNGIFNPNSLRHMFSMVVSFS